METIYWGPAGWRFLHILTFLYPEIPDTSDKILMRDMMNLIPDILPCKYCRASFSKYMANLDITPALESRVLMIEWCYKMHNKVNKKLRSQFSDFLSTAIFFCVYLVNFSINYLSH